MAGVGLLRFRTASLFRDRTTLSPKFHSAVARVSVQVRVTPIHQSPRVVVVRVAQVGVRKLKIYKVHSLEWFIAFVYVH